MLEQVLDDITIEKVLRDRFGVRSSVQSVIVRQIPTSRTTYGTVFLTEKKQLYALISGQAPLTYGDVQKIIRRMGLVAETYVPPFGDRDYFDRIATQKFEVVFPGRKPVVASDLEYYRTLVPYQPALVKISEVPEGVIRQFDPHDTTNWRVSIQFTYRRIKAV